MSKQCAKCMKTVFPVEELKCLDKVWHKGCFRCQECNMSLNMKNYKGYNKLPYCNAHYPKTTHTVVAETPETRRIAENTKIQSNVKYHAEFEKSKGAKISIADDPETKRVRKNMETISNISYHGDLQKRNQMEMNRPVEQDDHVSRRRPGSTGDYEPRGRQPGSISDYNPTANQGGTPYSQRQSQGTAVYDSRTGVDPHQRYSTGSSSSIQNGSHGRKVGSISDYDPVNEKYGSIAGQYSGYQQQASPPPPPPPQEDPVPQYNPVEVPPPHMDAQPQQARQPAYQPPPQQQQQPYRPPGQPQRNQVKYKAMYDYTAADDDEVSFREDDFIIKCEIIDAGWMEGTVERTGLRGMLPSNYVEKCS